jgi:hydrogenase nickel incorporation protein HypB
MVKNITVRENIQAANHQLAAENKGLLEKANLFSLNIMASPGAGKTSLIEMTLAELIPDYKVAVIDGDIATSIDAERAEKAGATALQINTGGQCHIDALMLKTALMELDLLDFDLLLVENVGNLICPASFELGTAKNLLIASIPEGDDKPYKYPGMYQDVDALVINKIDLLPYVKFDMDYFIDGVRQLNPDLTSFQLSCQTGEGIPNWIEWLKRQVKTRASS